MGNRRKRIALFVGQADESYQSRFIKGFLQSAFAFDMDVCVFSMYRKYQNTVQREKGEANIFSLMRAELFDGAVILEDTIQAPDTAGRLEEKLHREFEGKPVLVIEKDSEYFPSVFTDCHDAVCALVAHLTEVHGCKDIAYLSGKRWHKHSLLRQQAVQEELGRHGLDLAEDRIYFGDFWYQSGELCADTMLAEDRKLPDAVVCANDAMAIGLCKVLEENGVKIPEDIRVVSYDTTYDGQTSPVAITSAVIPAEDIGRYSARYMDDKFCGVEPEPYKTAVQLVMGESCGCHHEDIRELRRRREAWDTEESFGGFDSVHNTMADDINSQTDLESYMGTVYSYAYQIRGAESFHLCIGDMWRYMGQSSDLHFGNDGYPERMIYAVRYNSDRKGGIAGLDKTFSSSDILPELFDDSREKPRAVFFTPVFFENYCFGYAAVDYGSVPRSYDDTYRRWIRLVSRGIENLRRYLTTQFVRQQLSNLKSSKFLPVNSAYDNLEENEKADYQLVGRIIDENLFSYRFQPIVSAVDGSIYSYEALMRSDAERNIPPMNIIKYAEMQNRLEDIEKATFFNVLKIVEERFDILNGAKVFINSIPGVKLAEKDLAVVEDYFDRYSDTIVVELTEEAELGDAELERLKEILHKHNIKIAVDDYGTGYSNVNNLLRYMPNYVKIDRALLSEIHAKPQKQHFVKEVINFCHDNDILALAEGVETSEELRMVMYLGADLIQGFYIGKPNAEIVGKVDEAVRREIITHHNEILEGGTTGRYIAGRSNRVSLSALTRENCRVIVVGSGAMIYKDITVFGTPGTKTDVHIKVENDYRGRITLDNAYLSNSSGACIEIGENCDVTVGLVGDNFLSYRGITVPESSKLTVEGDGNLSIKTGSAEFCGIGNMPDAASGELVFALTGMLEIKSNGLKGVCIGSGLGGRIRMFSGLFVIDAYGTDNVCIGSLTGDTNILIDSCNMSLEYNSHLGAGIGSASGNAKISVSKAGIKLIGSGREIAGIGSVKGDELILAAELSTINIKQNAVVMTGIGSVRGESYLDLSTTTLKIDMSGQDAMAVGGFSDDSQLSALESDFKWTVNNNMGADCFIKPENMKIVRTTLNRTFNGRKI